MQRMSIDQIMRTHYSTLILRIGLGFVFLYFGLYEKLLYPELSEGYFNAAQHIIPFLPTGLSFVYFMGLVEIIISFGLFLGILPRFCALIAAAIILGVIITLGILVVPRDVGLLAAALSLAVSDTPKKEIKWTKH